MKKIYYFLSLFLLIAITLTSCQKEKSEVKNEQTKSDATIITRLLKSFKLNLLSKSGEPMAADSAEWYLEGLLNLEKANNNHLFGDVDFYYDTLLITIVDEQISVNDLNYLYSSIDAWVESIRLQSGNEDYTFDVIDLNLETSGLKSDAQNLIVSLSGGVLGTGLNYNPFGPSDYWYWGFELGKCGNYIGQYVGRDATTELEYRFNHPLSPPVAGYFTSVEKVTVFPGYDPIVDDPNSPNGSYMIFSQGGIGYEYDYCIPPSELNYYLSKFDYIRDARKPACKEFKTVDVSYTFSQGLGYWDHVHYYEIFYGVKQFSPIVIPD